MARSLRLGWSLLALVAAFGLLIAGGLVALIALGRVNSPSVAGDEPPDRVVVNLSGQPQTLAFSPDGRWLAGGTWGGLPPHAGPTQDRSAVYLIGPDAKAVAATLDVPAYVQALAFSPDGQWLAVAAAPPVTALVNPSLPPGELLVCEVPGLAVKHRATAAAKAGFWDVAWAGDGSAVYAVEGLTDYLSTNTVRGWAAAGWAERPAITQPHTLCFSAVAVSPDGKTVAVADKGSQVGAPVLRLFDAGTGQVRAALPLALPMAPTLAYAADGQAIRADDRGTVAWIDAATGAAVTPSRLPTAEVARSLYGRCRAVSADGSVQAVGEMNRTKLVGQGMFDSQNYGAFAELTRADGSRLGRWRLADQYGAPPAVALTADGGRVAATFGTPTGGVVVVWPVPK